MIIQNLRLLEKKFEKDHKSEMKYNMFTRYNLRVKEFYNGLDNPFKNRFGSLLFKFEQKSFLESDLVKKLMLYKVIKFL